jgi:hypothetical protein
MYKRVLQTLSKNYAQKIYKITTQKCYSHTKKDILGEALANEVSEIKQAGTWKEERIITSPQSSEIKVKGTTKPVLNFCANNYLGLSNNKEIINAAKATLDSHAFGMSSVRFICGTQVKRINRVDHPIGYPQRIGKEDFRISSDRGYYFIQ